MRKMALVGTVGGLGAVMLAAGMFIGAAAAPATQSCMLGHRLGDGPLGRFIMGRMGRAMTLKADLNITDAQREQLKTILTAHKQDLVTAIKPVVDKKRALRDAVLADKPDDKAIRAAATDLGNSVGDAAVAFAKIKVELAKVLTPDQIKTLEKFHADNDQALDAFFKEIQTQ